MDKFEIDQELIDFFWSRVDVEDENGCMLWNAYVAPESYGQFKYKKLNIRTSAHKISCIINHGWPEDDKVAAHECKNKHCVAPKHVVWKTYKENTADRVRDNTDMSREKHVMAKLTEDEIAEIRKLYATGNYYQWQLGKQFGVTQTQIWRIVHNKSWID